MPWVLLPSAPDLLEMDAASAVAAERSVGTVAVHGEAAVRVLYGDTVRRPTSGGDAGKRYAERGEPGGAVDVDSRRGAQFTVPVVTLSVPSALVATRPETPDVKMLTVPRP